ncbi:MAG: DUF4956 domain-containing protein [Deltaproteobacteria bacterium]|nr:DUF4956 domain-containing protein [Deltaproteobacteria bacterium]
MIAPDLSVFGLVFTLLVAGLCGQLLGWMYAKSSGVLSYSQTFVQSLALLSMVTAVVSGVIGDSLARAFGLAAALAVVRFRTPVKDARDAVFLFGSVGVGMACGIGHPGVAVIATLAIGATAIYLDATSYGSRNQAEGLLRLRFEGDMAQRDELASILSRHCASHQLSAARVTSADGPEERVYDINLRSTASGDALLRDLSATGSVSAVSLLPQARAGES